jgi:hypothetical protein
MIGAIEPAQAAEIVNRVLQDFQPQDHGVVSHPRQGPFCLREQRARCGRATPDVGRGQSAAGDGVEHPCPRCAVKRSSARWATELLLFSAALSHPERPIAPRAARHIAHRSLVIAAMIGATAEQAARLRLGSSSARTDSSWHCRRLPRIAANLAGRPLFFPFGGTSPRARGRIGRMPAYQRSYARPRARNGL